MKRFLHACLAVLFAAVLFGCAPSLEKQIVGKWKEQGGDRTIQFFPSGDISITDKLAVAKCGNN